MRNVFSTLSFGPETRVVLIATSVTPFESSLGPLPQVENNVNRLARVLKDPDVIGLRPADVIIALNFEHSTQILESIADASEKAKDTLIVYYAGHGLRGNHDDPLFVCAQRTTSKNKEINGVSISDVRATIAKSSARKRILILDCCFAGSGIIGEMSNESLESEVSDGIDINGTYAIAAATANRKALAPPNKDLTAFTSELLDVLENGFEGGPELLTIEDVFQRVRSSLNRDAGMPVPVKSNWDDGEKFLIARNRFFKSDDSSKIAESIDGLRDTLTSYGLKIQALEQRTVNLDAKIANADPATSSDAQIVQIRSGPWAFANVTEKNWASWPDEIRRTASLYLVTARSSRRFLVVSASLAAISCFIAFLPIVYSGQPNVSVLISRISLQVLTIHIALIVIMTLGIMFRNKKLDESQLYSKEFYVEGGWRDNFLVVNAVTARYIPFFGARILTSAFACGLALLVVSFFCWYAMFEGDLIAYIRHFFPSSP